MDVYISRVNGWPCGKQLSSKGAQDSEHLQHRDELLIWTTYIFKGVQEVQIEGVTW